jgi:uncharacterized OsmC-like protein
MSDPHASTSVRDRQDPLRTEYRTSPEHALIEDRARARANTRADPFHGNVRFGGPGRDGELTFGIHKAVGGDHDLPNPGDLLCGALASCLDSTIRMIAGRMSIELLDVDVDVRAQVDVRGTLMVDPDVPVGFQNIECSVGLRMHESVPAEKVTKLTQLAHRCCVVMQTLQSGVSIKTHFETAG